MTDENNSGNLNNESHASDSFKESDTSKTPEEKNSSTFDPNAPAKAGEEAKTDKAVDDILKNESDKLLTIEDAPAQKNTPAKKRWFNVFKKKKVFIPVVIILVIFLLLIIPQSRYPIFKLFWKQDYKIMVLDSQTNKPVSDANILLDGLSATTNDSGYTDIKVPVGHEALSISKKYYQDLSQTILVPLRVKNTVIYKLVATGRQVPITVVNKISAAPVANAKLEVAGTDVVTDKNGQATIVLPAGESSVKGSVTASSYNNLPVTVSVTTKTTAANTFALTPIGQIYFLSNASGNIDVVKTNLDGSDRQTVLAGTGQEDLTNTVLLASRDWKYLALLSKRTSSQYPELYLINTSNDQQTTIDSTAANYTLVGWSGHDFVYSTNQPNIPSWKAGASSIKSYDADTGALATLVSSSASGNNAANAKYDTFWNIDLFGSNIIYSTTWYAATGYLTVSGEKNSLAEIQPDGTNAKTIKSVDAASYYFSNLDVANPTTLYFGVYNNSSSQVTYYSLDTNANLTQSNTITNDTVSKAYPTYLISPSGNKTFWSDIRDGKNTLFVGDGNGNNAKQITTLSDYSPYGWFSDSYILVEKNGSELYIMPASGGQALKISDYYKVTHVYNGYGGGYGGL